MEYQLTLIERPTHLHAKAVGAHTPENAVRFLKEAYAACMERKRDALLLEMSLSGPSLGSARIFDIVRERSAEGATLRKIAYVDANADPERARFAETVAMNRGVNVRLFAGVAEAQAWLAQR